MAYAFNRIMDVMGRGRDDDGQNIFEPGGTDRIRSASTEGSMTPGGGATAPVPHGQAGPEDRAGSATSRAKVFQRNQGRVQSPVDLSAAGQKIKDTGDQLQSRANAYVQSANVGGVSDAQKKDIAGWVKTGNVGTSHIGAEPMLPEPGEVQSARSGDKGWLNTFIHGPGRVEAYRNDVNTQMADVPMLGTDAGISALFRAQQGAEYNAGDAALDTALLRKNAAFNELRDQTLSQYGDLQRSAREIGGKATEEAQKLLEASHGMWRSDVDDILGGHLAGFEKTAKDREKAFDAALGKVSAADKAMYEKEAQALLAKLAKDPRYADLAKYMTSAYAPTIDKFYKPTTLTADKTNWKDFVTADDAQGWNRILSLLGKGGDVPVAGQYGDAGADKYAKGTFDAKAYEAAVLKAAAAARDVDMTNAPIVVEDAPSPVVAAAKTPPAGGKPSKAPPFMGTGKEPFYDPTKIPEKVGDPRTGKEPLPGLDGWTQTLGQLGGGALGKVDGSFGRPGAKLKKKLRL